MRGSEDAGYLLNMWSCQTEQGKFYYKGHRIHHGAIGAVAEALGNFLVVSYLQDFGRTLQIDDIADRDKWFKFKTKAQEKSEESSKPAKKLKPLKLKRFKLLC